MTPCDDTGGRFPSDLQVPRNRGESTGQSSASSDGDAVAIAGAIPPSATGEYERNGLDPYRLDGVTAGTRTVSSTGGHDPNVDYDDYFDKTPGSAQGHTNATNQNFTLQHPFLGQQPAGQFEPSAQNNTASADWMIPAAAVAGAGVGAAAVEAHKPNDRETGLNNTRGTQASSAIAATPVSPTNENDSVLSESPEASRPGTRSSNTVVPLGGNEAEGARETGTLPKVIRHATDMSISKLHVPGEFPKRSE